MFDPTRTGRALSVTPVLFLVAVLGVFTVVAFTQPAAAQEPIKIGSLMSMSGALAAYGPPIHRGTVLAARHFNQAGGVLRRDIEIVNRDTRTDPTSGVDAARKLVQVDGVTAFVGALSSGVSMPVAESVSIPNKVVQISPASTTPAYTALEDDDYVFRTVVSDEYQGVILGQLALDRGYESMSVVHVNNAYGKGLAKSATDWFKSQGGRVHAVVPYEKGKPSYSGELSRATGKDPDVLVLIGYPENGSTIVRQAISEGYIDEFLFVDGLKSPELVENVGAQYLNGTYGTTPGSRKTPSLKTFNEEYEKEFGKPPPKPFMTNAYDAVAVIGLAIQRAGENSSQAIRDNLRAVANPPGEEIYAGPDQFRKAVNLLNEGKEINYQGAGSIVTFNKAGDVVSPIDIWKIERGQIMTVRSEETAIVDGQVVPEKVAE